MTRVEPFLAGAVAGLAVAMPVGAIGAYLLGLAARERLGVAVAAGLGVASVDGAYALVAALGGAGLRTGLDRVSGALTGLAVLLLVALAGRTLLQGVRRFRAEEPATVRAGRPAGAGRAYAGLVGLTAVNPATLLTFSAVALGPPGGAAGRTGPDVALFAVGALVASAAWQLLLVGSGAVLGHTLAGRRGQLAIAVTSAFLMLALAAAVLLRR